MKMKFSNSKKLVPDKIVQYKKLEDQRVSLLSDLYSAIALSGKVYNAYKRTGHLRYRIYEKQLNENVVNIRAALRKVSKKQRNISGRLPLYIVQLMNENGEE